MGTATQPVLRIHEHIARNARNRVYRWLDGVSCMAAAPPRGVVPRPATPGHHLRILKFSLGEKAVRPLTFVASTLKV